MAADEDTISVQIDDLDTIQVAVAEEPEKPVKKKTERVRLDPDPAPVDHEKALRAAEEARRAAEATAASERARADAAERARLQAQQAAEQSAQRAQSSEISLLDNSISAAQGALSTYQEDYVRAAENGEFAKMGELQTKIAKAAAALDRLEGQKSTIEVRSAEGSVSEPQVTQSKDESFLGQFAAPAQSWLRQHRDCWPPELGGDRSKYNKMMAGHYEAVAQNVVLNSPEYFTLIEGHLGGQGGTLSTSAVAADPTHAHQHASRAADITPAETSRKPVPAAPVSRDAPSASGQPQRTREVRLTREQQEMAKMSFPHLPEAQALGLYARNLLELESEGKLGRTTH